MKILYLPVLKWKKGEQEALKNLKASSDTMTPIIELIDECTPSAFFSSLFECFEGTIYYDTDRLDDEGREFLLSYISYTNKHNISAYPVLNVNDIFSDLDTSSIPAMAIKVPVPVDFEGPSFDSIISKLTSYDTSNITLILDAGEISTSHAANTIFAFYSDIIAKHLNKLANFKNLTICLTSFPEQLSIEAGQDMTYNRYDIKIFRRLHESFQDTPIISRLSFSDYGVTKFTETELDFSKMKYGVLPKVKYTTYDQYIVKKGEKDRIKNIFTRSYVHISQEIINSNYYFGKSFSYGDKCIYEKATQPTAKPGNGANWVTYCANHHLNVVLEQLSILSSS